MKAGNSGTVVSTVSVWRKLAKTPGVTLCPVAAPAFRTLSVFPAISTAVMLRVEKVVATGAVGEILRTLKPRMSCSPPRKNRENNGVPPTNEREFDSNGVPNGLRWPNRNRKPSVRVFLPASIRARASRPAKNGRKCLYSKLGCIRFTLPRRGPPENAAANVTAVPFVGSRDELSVLYDVDCVIVDCVTPL